MEPFLTIKIPLSALEDRGAAYQNAENAVAGLWTECQPLCKEKRERLEDWFRAASLGVAWRRERDEVARMRSSLEKSKNEKTQKRYPARKEKAQAKELSKAEMAELF